LDYDQPASHTRLVFPYFAACGEAVVFEGIRHSEHGGAVFVGFHLIGENFGVDISAVPMQELGNAQGAAH